MAWMQQLPPMKSGTRASANSTGNTAASSDNPRCVTSKLYGPPVLLPHNFSWSEELRNTFNRNARFRPLYDCYRCTSLREWSTVLRETALQQLSIIQNRALSRVVMRIPYERSLNIAPACPLFTR